MPRVVHPRHRHHPTEPVHQGRRSETDLVLGDEHAFEPFCSQRGRMAFGAVAFPGRITLVQQPGCRRLLADLHQGGEFGGDQPQVLQHPGASGGVHHGRCGGDIGGVDNQVVRRVPAEGVDVADADLLAGAAPGAPCGAQTQAVGGGNRLEPHAVGSGCQQG